MFERRRTPVAITLSTASIVTKFFDVNDPDIQKLIGSKEKCHRVDTLDELCWVFSAPLSRLDTIQAASREVAYAISLTVNSINSFPTLSKAFAVGDVFAGFACLRLCLEGLVRAGALFSADEKTQRDTIYKYENGFRDKLSRQRNWTGMPKDSDSIPVVIGKLISNPLTDCGNFDERCVGGRSERMEELPSKKSDQRDREDLSFGRCIDQLEYPIGDEGNTKQRVKDWHALSSSFLHADPFAVHLANAISADNLPGRAAVCNIYVDILETLTILFTDIVICLLNDLDQRPEAHNLSQTRERCINSC